MFNFNLVKVLCSCAVFVFAVFLLPGYAAAQASHDEQPDVSAGSKAYQLLSSSEDKFEKEFEAYINVLMDLRVVPSADWSGTAGHHERLSTFVRELNADLLDIEAGRIADELFQKMPLVSIEGNLYPAFVISMIQKSMVQMSESQGEALYGKLENELNTMYSIRMDNCTEFARWVNGWVNYPLIRSCKELAGTWAREYASQYDAIINKGLDTSLPERLVTETKDKADILLSGYINVLACTKLLGIDEIVDGIYIQTMSYEQFLMPYTLMQKVFYAGTIMGIDTSAWQQETNNRLAGAIDAGAFIANVGIIVVTKIIGKLNPVTAIIEVVFEAGRFVWYCFKKDGKIKKFDTELKETLHNELTELLAWLRGDCSVNDLLAQADA